MPCKPRHPWDAEVTRPSLQSPVKVLFVAFYYVLFVVPGCVAHNQGVTLGIFFDRHVQDIRLAIAYYVPFAVSYPWTWERSVYHAFASGHFDKPRMNNTSGFLFGDYVVLFYHNADK